MGNLEKFPSFEAVEEPDDEKEELNGLLEQYNDIVNHYVQLSIADMSTDEPFDFIHSNPTQYIEIYARIDDQTPLDEASTKMDKIKKAIAIEQLRAENKTYTDEEKRKIGEELAEYFRQNEDQYDILSGSLNGSGAFPDDRLTWGYWTHSHEAQAFNNTELFWNLKNDTMSTEAWAYVCRYGFKDVGNHELIDSCETLPELSSYAEDLLKRQKEERERIRRQEVEQYRTAHPDIFANPDERIMRANMEPFLNRVNRATLHEMMKEYGDDYETYCSEMVNYLSGILELKETPSIIHSPQKDDKTLGSFNSYSNTIKLYHTEDRSKAVSLYDIDTIAHEIWHAYQHQVADGEDKDLSPELYKKNFENYVTAEEDFHGYATQLVEAEARMFAEDFTERCAANPERSRAKKIGHMILVVALSASAAIASLSIANKRTNYRMPNQHAVIHYIDDNGEPKTFVVKEHPRKNGFESINHHSSNDIEDPDIKTISRAD